MNQTTEKYREIIGAKSRKSRAKAESDAVASTPVAPRWLSKDARREWNRVVPALAARGVLTDVDAMVLATYVGAVARYVAAQRSIDEEGIVVDVIVADSNGKTRQVRKVNPALKIVESCERVIHKFLREFGGTPRSRDLTKPAKREPKKSDGKYDLLADMKAKNAH